MPDENTIRHLRNRMTETGTLKRVLKAFDWQLHKKGYIPMPGQIVVASLVPEPMQLNTDGERDDIKAGNAADEIWPASQPRRRKRTPMGAGRSRSAARCALFGEKIWH